MSESSDTATEADADPVSQPRSSIEIQSGERIGRYVVLSRLGAGGMGVVFAAYDPELDRNVALKVLQTRTAGRESREARRLVREAMAMARLNHPNVLTLHDVGEHDGLVFFSMELVEGKTLKRKLYDERSSWSDVLALFIAAGRGLAAAHERGIAHRDFKPDNVMVGDDGRVRVMDFGLARDTARNTGSTPGADDLPATGPVDAGLTQGGKVVGTPGYIAPELHRGEPADMRSDQFAFCVALYEGLFGRRPFTGDTALEVAAATMDGRVNPIPAGSDVPAWLRKVVLRGLATDPFARHPSMDALLGLLGQHRIRRRRRTMVGLALGACLVAGAVVGAAQIRRHRTIERCTAEGKRIDELWNADIRERMRSEFVREAPTYAGLTFDKAAVWLDRYAEGWRAMRTEVCIATELDAQRDADLYARSVACLDDRRMTFESLLQQMAGGGDSIAYGAVDAATGLPALAPCNNDVALLRRPELGSGADPQRDEIRALLAEGLGRALAGSSDEGLALAREALRHASEIDAPSLEAQAHLLLAQLLRKAGKFADAATHAEQAFLLGGRLGEDRIAAEAACEATSITGFELRRTADALRWAQLAEMALGRLGGEDALLTASCLIDIGMAETGSAQYDEAQASFEEALSIFTREIGADHPRVAIATLHLGLVALERGDYAESERLEGRALELAEIALGPDHPNVSSALNNIGSALDARGEHRRALRVYERALEGWRNAHGEDHPNYAETLFNIAIVHYELGDFEKALELGTRALALFERNMGPDHPTVADGLNNLVNFAASLGDFEAAQRYQSRALALRQRTLPPDHPEVAASLTQLGILTLAQGDSDPAALARARSSLERALQIWETKFGPDHPDSAFALNALGNVLVEQGDLEPAVALLERALRVRDAAPAPLPSRAETRFALARALRQLGRDPRRARALATEALALYREGGEMFAADQADIEAWLAP